MRKKPRQSKKRGPGHPPADVPPAIDKIRSAAILLFSRHGYEGTSIAEIATLAGVAKPLVHYHFSSKEELWYSAVDSSFGALMKELDAMRTAVIGLAPEEMINMLAVNSVQFASRFFHLVSILDDEARSTGPRSDHLLKVFQVPSLKVASAIVDILNDTMRRGKAPIPAEHLVPAFMGAATFPFVNQKAIKNTYGVDVRDEGYALRHTAFLTNVLRSLFEA